MLVCACVIRWSHLLKPYSRNMVAFRLVLYFPSTDEYNTIILYDVGIPLLANIIPNYSSISVSLSLTITGRPQSATYMQQTALDTETCSARRSLDRPDALREVSCAATILRNSWSPLAWRVVCYLPQLVRLSKCFTIFFVCFPHVRL